MRSKINRVVIALVVCALMSIAVVAKERTETLNLTQDVTINGTLVKKGQYKLKFDEQTGELLIMKGKKVVAKTTAKVEARTDKADRTEVNTITNGTQNELKGITFRGENQRIVVGQAGMSMPASAQ